MLENRMENMMLYKAFLIKYAEIGIKGKNRYIFENALRDQIKLALSRVEGAFQITKEMGRIYVEAMEEYDYEEVIEALKCVFGIVAICPVKVIEDTCWESITKEMISYISDVYGDPQFSFKVAAKRADKNYPYTSPEICINMGSVILEHYSNMSVDIHNPEVLFTVEIRGKAYIYSVVIPGLGGLPVGTAGKAMVLLSGGIDSPVSSYMIAKRGVQVEAVYFHAPPYTSERAKQKVIDLAKQISKYTGPIKLHVINFTEIQMYIYDQCPHDQLTIIMKRYMLKIAETLGNADGCLGLVTGESIGQVASQTMQSMAVIEEACEMPIYRPVIAFDKQDIVDIAEKIGTYEISIQPYEDCCTTFVAKHPVTKPTLKSICKSEEHLTEKIDEMFQRALDTVEILMVSQED